MSRRRRERSGRRKRTKRLSGLPLRVSAVAAHDLHQPPKSRGAPVRQPARSRTDGRARCRTPRECPSHPRAPPTGRPGRDAHEKNSQLSTLTAQLPGPRRHETTKKNTKKNIFGFLRVASCLRVFVVAFVLTRCSTASSDPSASRRSHGVTFALLRAVVEPFQ